MGPDMEITIRPFEKESDYFECEALQKETWGRAIEEVVPASLAKIIQKIGGIAAGAFDTDGEMVGFVFGFTGIKDGKLVHWSHMLAVKPAFRDVGIGTRLKLYQRDVLLEKGVKEAFWTYDPLEAKNGHLNLNTLGAEIVEYVRDMYGTGQDSILFRGIGTDRFVVIWHIADERVGNNKRKERFFDNGPFASSALAVCRATESDPVSFPVNNLNLQDRTLRVEIPPDVHKLMSISIASAADWRKKTREAFQHYLSKDYRIVGFYRDQPSGRCYYCMECSGR
jgi:predicted GNAT superfamily acetyltransferase